MSNVGSIFDYTPCAAQRDHPDVRAGDHPDVRPSGLACGFECGWTSARLPIRAASLADVQADFERISCPKGLSVAQVNVMGLLLLVGPSITQYGLLAAELERHYNMRRTAEAIRRTVERLVKRGFIRRRQVREGTMHGVSFGIVEDRLCPHIRSPARPDSHPGIRADQLSAPSILEEKERKTLSISSHKEKLEALTEEDIIFHWPSLARAGFGTMQIRQIIRRREQVGEPLEHVMQGLTFAEWELYRQCMKDAKGNAVGAPLNWVFSILATQGYYPRPSGYISPAEQAERDRENILQREQEAREARFSAEAEAWAAALSPAERESILGPKDATKMAIPAPVRLRQYFKAEIWPDRLMVEQDTKSR